jgi:hypothetical protein
VNTTTPDGKVDSLDVPYRRPRLVYDKFGRVDTDSPEYIARRRWNWAYADGFTAAVKEVTDLYLNAVGPRGLTRALRKLARRAEHYSDDALEPGEFIEKVFEGDW